jgi:hypothetical protein
MKILACGGRSYLNRDRVFRSLDELKPDHVIHGGASGADSLAGIWARNRGVALTVYKADWEKHGSAAGPIRNQQMLDEGKPDLVVAFPGGKGTADMVKRAKRAGIKIVEIE